MSGVNGGFMFERLAQAARHNSSKSPDEMVEMILSILKKPTRAMVDAGNKIMSEGGSSREIFADMIAEALGEEADA